MQKRYKIIQKIIQNHLSKLSLLSILHSPAVVCYILQKYHYFENTVFPLHAVYIFELTFIHFTHMSILKNKSALV